MTTSDAALKTELIRLAGEYPPKSAERRKLLQVITGADFDPTQIGEVEPGALEEGTPEQSYQGDQFTQQEFSELGDKQEKGELGMKVDEDEKSMPTGQQEKLANEKPLFDSLVRLAKDDATVRGPIIAALKESGVITPDGKVATDKISGCEKLPEGPMRDNCEKKKDDDKGDDKGGDKDEKKDKDDKKPDFLKDKKAAEQVYKDYVRDYKALHKKYPLAVPLPPLSEEKWNKSLGKKASALPTENVSVRALAVRLAHGQTDPAARKKILDVVLAFEQSCGVDRAAMLKSRKLEAAAKTAGSAIDAAKAVTKAALELGYDKDAAVAEGKKAHAAWGSVRQA